METKMTEIIKVLSESPLLALIGGLIVVALFLRLSR